MTETPEPTPTSPDAAPGDARDAAAAWFGEVEGHAEVTEEDRRQADDLFDWMGHFGYRIVRATPDAGGAVMISRELLTRLRDACIGLDMFGLAVDIDEVLDPAIAASGGQT